MNKKEKTRFLTVAVRYCFFFISAFAVASYVASWFDVDTSQQLALVCGVFGGELVLTMVLKLIGEELPKRKVTLDTSPEKKNNQSNG